MPLKLVRRGDIWYVRGTVRGHSIFKTTGTSNREAAEEIRAKAEVRSIEESIHGREATTTFGEAADSFIATGGSPRFLIEADSKGNQTGINIRLGDLFLHKITQEQIDRLAKEIYPGCLPETLNRQFYAPFIAVWRHAVRQKMAKQTEWQRPKKRKGTNVVVDKKYRSGSRPVSYERAATFVCAMSPAPAMLMTALFYTGMRPIELYLLEADRVNLADRWIVLDKTKTGEPRGVPIHEFLVPLFESLLPRAGILFRTPRGEQYPIIEGAGGQLKSAIKGARKRSEIEDVSPYTARHTVSTQLVVNGVHPYIKDQILGHAADDMSRLYTNIPQRPLIDAINTLPVPDAWRAAWWWKDPLGNSRKLVPGTGARNDLKDKK